MINIHKAVNADTRSKNDGFNKESLLADTKSHIGDVSKGLDFIADLLIDRGGKYDHTKIDNIDAFYDALKDDNVKKSFWYNMHITKERHHLKSNPPKDVNLIDVLEHLVDCTMAGMTRSGTIYDIDLSPELLVKACANTVEMLKENIEVIDSDK